MGDQAPPMSARQKWAVALVVAWALVFTFVSGLMLVEVATSGSLLVPAFVAFAVLLACPLIFLVRRRRANAG
jgi:hypothetical protein